MLFLEKIIEEVDKRTQDFRIEGTSTKFSELSDHSYIVGKIDGMSEIKDFIIKILKDADDEYEHNAR